MRLVRSITDAPAACFGAHHRWVSLAVGVCMQLCAGTLYSITAWGVPLQEAAGWDDPDDSSLNMAETTAGTRPLTSYRYKPPPSLVGFLSLTQPMCDRMEHVYDATVEPFYFTVTSSD